MSKETVADIRAELVAMGLTPKEAASIKGKANLITKREEMQSSTIDVDEEYEVEYPEHEGLETMADEDEYTVDYEDEFDETDAAFEDYTWGKGDDPNEYEVEYDDIDAVEENDDFHSEIIEIEDKIVDADSIAIGSAGWQDYVMGLFTDEELISNPKNEEQKVPCLAGLSRVANSIFDIVETYPVSIDTDFINGHPAATVRYQVTAELNGRRYVYGAIGDAWIGSMGGEYSQYPGPIAESRAESRVLKKLLQLRNIPSYEEISKTGEANKYQTSFFDEAIEAEPIGIKDSQKTIITQKANQFGIDVFKLINKPHFVNPEENPEILFDSIDDVPYNVATKIAAELAAYQSATEESKEIPEEILK